MKQPIFSNKYLALLFGIVILLFAIEILLIYIAIKSQANENITSNCRKVNKSTTISVNTTTDLTTPTLSSTPYTSTITNITTVDTTTVTRTTKSSKPSIVTTTPLPTSEQTIKSNTLPKTTTLPPTKKPTTTTTTVPTTSTVISPLPTSPYSTTSDTITTTTGKVTLNITKFPTTSTTLATNSTNSTPTTPYTTPMVPTFSTISQSTMTSTITTSSITNDPDTSNTTSEVTTKKSTVCLPPKFNYVLKDAEERVCVLANMMIHIKLQHITKDFKLLMSTLTVPLNATRTTGTCTKETANMTLSWKEPAKNQIDKKNKIIFNYAHDNIKFFLDSIFIDVHLNGEEIRGSSTDLQLFSAAVENGIFTCKKNTKIIAEKELSRIDVVISNISLIVFNKCFNNSKKRETFCSDGTVIKIITIIGIVIVCILLVFFVLYIWRIKRKKNFV